MAPQSMMRIIANSIGFYKNNLQMLLPISVIFGVLNVIETILGYQWQIDLNSIFKMLLWQTDVFVTIGVHLIVGIISSFCGYWSVFFANELLANKSASYSDAFKKVMGRFLRLLVLSVILTVFYSILSFGAMFLVGKLSENVPLFIFSIIFFILLILFLGYYFVVCHMEILIRNLGIISSIKRSFAVTFKFETLFRFLYFTILLFLSILIFVPIGSIGYFIVITFPLIETISIIVMLMLIPFYMVFFVNFYNDLILRFES